MHNNPQYENVVQEVTSFLRDRVNLAIESGIPSDRIVIDPGIGFGKTVAHNLQIIKHLDQLKVINMPILLGTSRKSFIGKILNAPVQQREFGTASTVTYGILQGADIVRVHDVANMKQTVQMTDAIRGVN